MLAHTLDLSVVTIESLVAQDISAYSQRRRQPAPPAPDRPAGAVTPGRLAGAVTTGRPADQPPAQTQHVAPSIAHAAPPALVARSVAPAATAGTLAPQAQIRTSPGSLRKNRSRQAQPQ